MPRHFTFRRRAILAGLSLLVAADVALGVYSWHMANAPLTPAQQLTEDTRALKFLSADVARAERIRTEMPATQRDCTRFEQSLLPATTGYSAVTAELGDIARKSGLAISSVGFHQKEIPAHGLVEITLEATVTGPYASVVKFVNGLQRSPNIYALDSLALAADSQNAAGGAMRVTLHMTTYFRNA
jgi:Tfp pilus assembly protein PilO